MALSKKTPEIIQLLEIFECSRLFTKRETEDKVAELALACCRLQQEILGHQLLQSEVEGDLRQLASWVDSVLSGNSPHVEEGSSIHTIVRRWK